jgi:hypothetical protein
MSSSAEHVAWLCIVGFAGVGTALVVIANKLAWTEMRIGRLVTGYRAVEYHPDGKVKKVEYAPVEHVADRRHNPD